MKKKVVNCSYRELKTDEKHQYNGGKALPSPKIPDANEVVIPLLGDWHIPEVDHLL